MPTGRQSHSMKVFIADNQPNVRYALRVLLQKQPDIAVIGESSSSDELPQMMNEFRPDVLIVDWQLSDEINADTLTRFRQSCPQLSIIVMSGRPECETESLSAGADAFISKIDPPEHLLAVIKSIQHERAHYSNEIE